MTKQQHERKALKAEQQEIDKLCKELNFKFQPIGDKYGQYEGYLTTKKQTYVIEVKVRKNYSAKQLDKQGGIILEQKKLKGIIERAKEEGVEDLPILYINFFSDETRVYLLPKNKSDYKWEEMYLQKNDYSKQPIIKVITKLKHDKMIYAKSKL